LQYRFEDTPVGLTVEITGSDEVQNPRQRRRVEQNGA
jgi:hypothetical protein